MQTILKPRRKRRTIRERGHKLQTILKPRRKLQTIRKPEV